MKYFILLFFILICSCEQAINSEEAKQRILNYFQSFDLQDGGGNYSIDSITIISLEKKDGYYLAKTYVLGSYSNNSLQEATSSSINDTLFFEIRSNEKNADIYNPEENQ